MEIRPYEPRDRAQCIAIFESNMPLFFAPSELADLEFWLNGQDEKRVVYKEAAAEHYYVVEQNNVIVASGGFFIPKEGVVANMTWGMVDHNLHKMGIGTALFKFRLEQIQNLYPGYSISLDTTKHSFRFFEKIGFKVVEITNDFYMEGMHRYDMVSG